MKLAVVDADRLPEAHLLREIAHHINELRAVILPNWVAALHCDPRAEHAVAALRDDSMQTDLLSWASYIEEINRGL